MIDLPFLRDTDSGPDADPATHTLNPSKILGIGRNYRAHAAEMGAEAPTEPLVFMRAPSSAVGPSAPIVRRAGFQRVDYEGELCVVIGKRAARVPVADALSHVLGYTCANDVTVRDLQKSDKLWWRAKGMDGTFPVGPVLATDLDPSDLRIVTRVNGEVRQDGRTSQMIFSVPQIVSFVSQYLTLLPGDLIITGTPAGVGNLSPGDRVEVEIEGIGTLANPVVGDGDRA